MPGAEDTCWNSILINGTDIRTWGYVMSAEGLLSEAPAKGDLVERDFADGAVWQPGPRGPYTFEVPVMMRSRVTDVALGQLRDLQAFIGVQVTLTRRLTVDGVDIAETCQAVMVSAPRVVWDFSNRQRIDCVTVWQALGVWA
jgi:hypothetical protein